MECSSNSSAPSERYSEISRSGNARLGSFWTPHGVFDTPNFMPVGTQATVKGVDCERLLEVGAQITLVNTYHLWLRPGPEVVNELGGIHKFSGWQGPILSDSGGFQVFSLKGLRKITDEGVTFQSHIDGSKKFLSPEKAIEIQQALGVDIAMVLDECLAGGATFEETARSLARTIEWEKRSFAARSNSNMAIFGITQGGSHLELRTRSISELLEIPFDGMAIGGLSVGEPQDEMYRVLEAHVKELPAKKIRYLMGVGTPEDIVQAVNEGVDLFDCVMPTRSGRFGRAFTSGSPPYINIKNAQYRNSQDPIDSGCGCVTCRNYSRAYLHHLFRVEEMLGPQLLSIHNLHHYLALMQEIRNSIRNDTFSELYDATKDNWKDVAQARNET